MVITAVLTDAIKDGVGRPRPDFFWRCFPDGVPVMCPSSVGLSNLDTLHNLIRLEPFA
jgi:hypothetical protein